MKKIFLSAAMIAVLGLGCFLAYGSSKAHDVLSDLQLENAEALSKGEGASDQWTCYSEGGGTGHGYYRCGNPCRWVDGIRGGGDQGTCYKQ